MPDQPRFPDSPGQPTPAWPGYSQQDYIPPNVQQNVQPHNQQQWQGQPGYGQVAPYYPQQPPQGWYAPPQPTVQRKSPGIAVLLGALIPGAGCMYADRTGPGIAILALWLISIPLIFVFFIGVITGFACWVISMVLAATMTQKWNADRGMA